MYSFSFEILQLCFCECFVSVQETLIHLLFTRILSLWITCGFISCMSLVTL